VHLQPTPCGAEAPNHLDIKLNSSGVKAAPEKRPHDTKAEVIFQAFYTEHGDWTGNDKRFPAEAPTILTTLSVVSLSPSKLVLASPRMLPLTTLSVVSLSPSKLVLASPRTLPLTFWHLNLAFKF